MLPKTLHASSDIHVSWGIVCMGLHSCYFLHYMRAITFMIGCTLYVVSCIHANLHYMHKPTFMNKHYMHTGTFIALDPTLGD